MRYSINNYVDSLMQSLEKAKDRDSVVSNFIKLLKKTGDIKNGPKILDKLHKKLIQRQGGNWFNIETARELSEPKFQFLKTKFSEKDHVDFTMNPELVAGVRITINEQKELDNSLQNKLNKLFK